MGFINKHVISAADRNARTNNTVRSVDTYLAEQDETVVSILCQFAAVPDVTDTADYGTGRLFLLVLDATEATPTYADITEDYLRERMWTYEVLPFAPGEPLRTMCHPSTKRSLRKGERLEWVMAYDLTGSLTIHEVLVTQLLTKAV